MLPDFQSEIAAALDAACRDLAPDTGIHPVVERPKQREMGDFACTTAMRLARVLHRPPGDIADQILKNSTLPGFVQSAEVVGGFINVRVRPEAKVAVVADILADPEKFGRGKGKHEHILLEFVSANPTGPLHIGHARAAAYGDSLARILEYAGWSVAREYYINDAGKQADLLTASVWLRHRWQAKNWDKMPLGTYRGRYLAEVAQSLIGWMSNLNLRLKVAKLHSQLMDIESRMESEVEGESDEKKVSEIRKNTGEEIVEVLVREARKAWEDKFNEFRKHVCAKFVGKMKSDLDDMGVSFDRWFSEQDDLRLTKKIGEALNRLDASAPGALYHKDGAQWFRASAYGDEKDRVVRRANGEFTYFAADIAYHDDKFRRLTPAGIPIRLVNVLGNDHHGYVPRLKAVVKALGHNPDLLETRLIQFVSLMREGKRVKMSTRAGNFVSLRELLDDVGKDAVRFFLVIPKNDQHMDFDMDAAVQESPTNPVYYLQYACARIDSILQNRENPEAPLQALSEKALSDALTRDDEVRLCEALCEFGEIIESAAKGRAPHALAHWLIDLAMLFHSYYKKVPVLSASVKRERDARLALLLAIRTVIARGLHLLGVEVPKEM